MKTFSDVIDVFEAGNLYVICYGRNEEILYEGTLYNIPYWVAKLPLDIKGCKKTGDYPIEYRRSLGEEYDNRPGWVVSLID